MQEKRKSIRVNKHIIVMYHVITDLLRSGSRTKDISAGGLCLPVIEQLKPGQFLDLEIRIDEFVRPIKALGEVVWQKNSDEKNFPFEIGIKFIDIGVEDHKKLVQAIQKWCAKSKDI